MMKSLLGRLFANDGGEVVRLPKAVLTKTSETHVILLPEIANGASQLKW